MKAFLAAICAVAVIGTATWVLLEKSMQQYSQDTFSTSAVRLPEHH